MIEYNNKSVRGHKSTFFLKGFCSLVHNKQQHESNTIIFILSEFLINCLNGLNNRNDKQQTFHFSHSTSDI